MAAIPGIGWLGAGLLQGATEAALTAIDGGSLEDVLKAFTVGFITGVVIHGAGKALSKIKFCFVAGTSILLATGAYKVIEDIHVGDIVQSYNERIGKFESKRVTQTFVNETNEISNVSLTNGEMISATPDHPFYANGKWIAANNLKAGDILLTINGKKVIVEKIQHQILESPIKVYNFTVDGNSTYIVGNSSVVVHNSCAHKKAEWRKVKTDFWKSDATKQAYKDVFDYTDDALAKMKLGKAPMGPDGWPIELHHIDGISNNMTNIVPMSRSKHMLQHMYERIFKGFI